MDEKKDLIKQRLEIVSKSMLAKINPMLASICGGYLSQALDNIDDMTPEMIDMLVDQIQHVIDYVIGETDMVPDFVC